MNYLVEVSVPKRDEEDGEIIVADEIADDRMIVEADDEDHARERALTAFGDGAKITNVTPIPDPPDEEAPDGPEDD